MFVYWSLPPRASDAPSGWVAAARFPLDLLRADALGSRLSSGAIDGNGPISRAGSADPG